MLSIADRLLDEARRRGVRLWADADLLRFDGPENALDERFLRLVRDHRDRILRRLADIEAEPDAVAGAWLNPLVANGAPTVLFVVPAAGSGPSVFRGWREVVPPDVDVVMVHLPGREERLDERPYTELEPLADQIAESIRGYGDRPFALFGHSMGALIAHEVATRFTGPELTALIVAGAPAPEFADTSGADADDDELLAALAEWAGTPAELLADRAGLMPFLPCLRADLKVCASARRPLSDRDRLNVPIVSLAGRGDESVSVDQVIAWADWTTAGFSSHTVPGGHFFPVTAAETVFRLIAGALARGHSCGCSTA